ncbi:protein FAM166B-like [Stegodyphus dumicola]|uniref:protein FAM166B-like n=1 Tax=Stegodyphus dumicola TaxID=202533 RepID=UPI0015A9601E|nr:protein FAM166B-like [Stegodyphus dumicola]
MFCHNGDTLEANYGSSLVQDLSSMETPQPHFIPGYTGCTPGAGPQRHFTFGGTYGHYTHDLLIDHPVGGGRLSVLAGDNRIIKQCVDRHHVDPKKLQDNPHYTLEPHVMPGYTGWIPGSGVKRSDVIGETYGRMSHIRFAKHPIAGDRLRPIHHRKPETVASEEEVKFFCYLHEITANDLKRRAGTVPGYTGHIPRATFRFGKCMTKITHEATAEFEKIQERKEVCNNGDH